MKTLSIAFVLALSNAAISFAAGPAPLTAANILSQSIGNCMVQNAQMVEQLTLLQAENAALKKQIDDTKKPDDPKDK